ncbi:MAG: hypothetical protein R3260_03445 [Pseudomonas sp.]|nr:hypothetical protein [Pseudomonas sp.]
MASFAIPTVRNFTGTGERLIDAFSKGRDLGKDMRQDAADRAYSRAIADAPEAGEGQLADTEQTDMLQEQTAEFGEAIPESEREVQKSTQKRQRLTTEQWANWRKSMMDAAAKSGDPARVREASKYVDEYQHKGFMDNMDMASNYLHAGDYGTAMKYLEDANEFMPNGRTIRFSQQGDKIVGEKTLEATGEPDGFLYFDRKNIGDFIERMRDPQKFHYFKREHDLKVAKDQREQALHSGKMDLQSAQIKRTLAEATRNDALADKATAAVEAAKKGTLTDAQYYKAMGDIRDAIVTMEQTAQQTGQTISGDTLAVYNSLKRQYDQLVQQGRPSQGTATSPAPAGGGRKPSPKALEALKADMSPKNIADFKERFDEQYWPAELRGGAETPAPAPAPAPAAQQAIPTQETPVNYRDVGRAAAAGRQAIRREKAQQLGQLGLNELKGKLTPEQLASIPTTRQVRTGVRGRGGVKEVALTEAEYKQLLIEALMAQ